MIRLQHKFQNKNLEEKNDDVFPCGPFPLRERSYQVNLLPSELTTFWRFGIVLCRTEDADFRPARGRYVNKQLKYVEVHCGDLNGRQAVNPNKLEIDTYYFPEYTMPQFTMDDYRVGQVIVIYITYYEATDVMQLRVDVGDRTFKQEFDAEGYPFFKLAAWADSHQFDINMELHIKVLTEYRFPVKELSEQDKRFLELLYSNFNEGKDYRSAVEIPTFYDIYPAGNVDYERLQHMISSDRFITLWGIWHVEPSSPIFLQFDEVIQCIRYLIQLKPARSVLSSHLLLQLWTGHTIEELKSVFEQIKYYPLCDRISIEATDMLIYVSSDRVRNEYGRYRSLQIFLNEYLGEVEVAAEAPALPPTVPDDNGVADVSKTILRRRKTADIDPVLGVKELAGDIAGLVQEFPDEKGQMIGIFGKWGRGKSTLIGELWKVLKASKDTKFIKVEYHAWKYQDTPASWAYLYELLCEQYLGKKKYLWRIVYYLRLLWLNARRLGFRDIVTLIFFAAIGYFYIRYAKARLISNKDLQWVFYSIGGLSILGFLQYFMKSYSTKAIDLVKKYTVRTSFKSSMGPQAEIQEELIKLLKVWVPAARTKSRRVFLKMFLCRRKQIVLIVEDMDRCSEEKIIQNIDALRIMLEDEEIAKRLVIVTAIDERILRNAIEKKYEFLNDRNAHLAEHSDGAVKMNILIVEYLDKLFITAVKLGRMNSSQNQEFLQVLLHDNVEPNSEPNVADKETSSQNEGVVSNSEQLSAEETIGDFDEKDFAANDFMTNTPAQPDNEIAVAGNTFKKLTFSEAAVLNELVGHWNDTTPRKIAIFYYRYLLSKNLIIDKYARLGRKNFWGSDHGIKKLMQLLRDYSEQHQPRQISQDKAQLLEGSVTHVISKEITAGVSVDDQILLLEVLEIVIAY